ncbi:MAG: glycosyltransferase family 2 protein [Acidobacteriota bacterium]
MTTKAATVLIPTHDHGETLRYSVPTALRQSVVDIEVFIVGDGVPDITREVARELAAADPRVRFFDFAKGESRGELYRHQVLQEASGEIVCYLFDDDLWLPDHIAVMRELLQHADFAFSMPVVVSTRGFLTPWFVDLSRPLHRRLFTDPLSSTSSVPTCAAHTMALYRRLPQGWRATPRGLAPDKYMWAQCLEDPATVARSASRPTAILFPDPPRRTWPASRRLEELAAWSRELDDPDWRQRFFLDVMAALAGADARHMDLVWRLYALSLRIPFGRRCVRALRRWLFPGWSGRRPSDG